MEYLGKLHQAAVEFPQTDIWMDSCGEEELEYLHWHSYIFSSFFV